MRQDTSNGESFKAKTVYIPSIANFTMDGMLVRFVK
jgi:hypothetical protein